MLSLRTRNDWNAEQRQLKRIDIVKQLFNTFLNQWAAYNYLTCIGLLPFNSKVDAESASVAPDWLVGTLANIKQAGHIKHHDGSEKADD